MKKYQKGRQNAKKKKTEKDKIVEFLVQNAMDEIDHADIADHEGIHMYMVLKKDMNTTFSVS